MRDSLFPRLGGPEQRAQPAMRGKLFAYRRRIKLSPCGIRCTKRKATVAEEVRGGGQKPAPLRVEPETTVGE